ncbi:MAG: hypothetical protein JWO89_2455 [Verrucomicrobiaceae bacterium]|nr:hypothetical protein [Verrucomicrobiaceae bacterium]
MDAATMAEDIITRPITTTIGKVNRGNVSAEC